MKAGSAIANFSTRHPWIVTVVMIQAALILALLAALPSLWPERFSSLHPLMVDTDPENMLSKDAPVRVYHDQMKEEMSLYDMVVVGVVNEEHPDGVFNPDSLRRVYELTEFAKGLRWPDPNNPDRQIGVVSADIIAPSMVDTIDQGEQPGSISFEWLMREPPATAEEALAIRHRAERIPFLHNTLLSEDGKALALYLPITSKDLSHRIYTELNRKIATFDGNDQFHITGLPVAEDVFGVEMFKQMAISAPVAMLVIFLLMLLFFRNLPLIVSPMIVAMAAVIMTMGLLIATGNTVHIMSSMIPIFIMPIAVLDAVHILSDFFDRYQATQNRRETIVEVVETLFMPMLYTSLTTVVGFGSLALVSIPPVQTFGIFVAFGVAVAWLLTITFIPAYIMFIPESWLKNFGSRHHHEAEGQSWLSRQLSRTGSFTWYRAKLILVVAGVLAVISIFGISRIRINDNPIKWFKPSHPIRVADRVLNSHFGGTYMAYLTIETPDSTQSPEAYAQAITGRFRQNLKEDEISGAATVVEAISDELARLGQIAETPQAVLRELEKHASDQQLFSSDEQYEAWERAMELIAVELGRQEAFKQPEVLRYVADAEAELLKTGTVGKSNSLVSIVKTVYRELLTGQDEDYRVPETAAGVAETLIQYQNSHRPQDLWHFVTPDYRKTVLWVQLTSGDNREMDRVVKHMEAYFKDAPVPFDMELNHQWFGLTYINVIWQERMVAGMLEAFLGSFLIVFLMMSILYRSALWGALSMLPLTVTIAMIYGLIGLVGKDYDMPVAVLSALSLGLAVDYAIHFLSRSRDLYRDHLDWKKTAAPVFGEPARAIARNAIVIGVGFMPLLLAPLMPYKTVGFFIAAILLTAGLASLLLLPALITVLEPLLFPRTRKCCIICQTGTCIVISVLVLVTIILNVRHFLSVGWTTITWVSLITLIILAQLFYFLGKSKRCRMETPVTVNPNVSR